MPCQTASGYNTTLSSFVIFPYSCSNTSHHSPPPQALVASIAPATAPANRNSYVRLAGWLPNSCCGCLAFLMAVGAVVPSFKTTDLMCTHTLVYVYVWIHYVRCSHRVIVVTVATMIFCYFMFLLPPSCQLYQGIHFSQAHQHTLARMHVDTHKHTYARIHIPISPCFCAPSIIAFPAGRHRLGIPSPTFIMSHTHTHTYICTFYICPRRSLRYIHRSFVRSLRSALSCFWTLLVQTRAYTHILTHVCLYVYVFAILFIQYVFLHSLDSFVGRSIQHYCHHHDH